MGGFFGVMVVVFVDFGDFCVESMLLCEGFGVFLEGCGDWFVVELVECVVLCGG